ncbi:MAG: peptidylprolyl isomerase [Rubrivivax sp.]|nr:peptidylprolyl isomerase [Rubrivivax sp.]
MKHLLAIAPLALLAACGGGGGGGVNPNVAGVDSASAATAMYGQDFVITLKGRNLDKDIAASATGCSALARSASEPYVSTADTAYYICSQAQLGEHQAVFGRPADGVTLATVPYTVPLPQVTLSLSNGAGVQGQVVLTLEARQVPTTVNNFLAYVKSGFYVDTVFHRVVPDFVVQGGGYAQPLVAGGTLPTLKPAEAPIPLEDNAGLSNLKWTVAMARTNVLASANSQFFVNLADNTFLDRSGTQRGYAVFGTVSGGTELISAMVAAPCASWPAFFAGDSASACLPSPNVVITAAAQTR